MPDLSIQIEGEELVLFPERAVFWPRANTLFVADTHWGKAATMRAHSIPIPMGTTMDDLGRLSNALARSGAKRLVLLGDAIHAREGRSRETFGAVAQWRSAHSDLEILLVRGNHDRGAGDPPLSLDIRCTNAPEIETPFVFQHHPTPSSAGYALAGHVHPAVRMRGRGMQRATLRCFHFTREVGTLPAFGSMCGRGMIAPEPGDRVYVIAEDEVIPAHAG